MGLDLGSSTVQTFLSIKINMVAGTVAGPSISIPTIKLNLTDSGLAAAI
jgi:hypothetical protein